MIRLFCDKCGAECDNADATLEFILRMRRGWRDLWPVTYYCKTCFDEYENKVNELEKDVAEKEDSLEKAKKRLKEFMDSCAKEERA